MYVYTYLKYATEHVKRSEICTVTAKQDSFRREEELGGENRRKHAKVCRAFAKSRKSTKLAQIVLRLLLVEIDREIRACLALLPNTTAFQWSNCNCNISIFGVMILTGSGNPKSAIIPIEGQCLRKRRMCVCRESLVSSRQPRVCLKIRDRNFSKNF